MEMKMKKILISWIAYNHDFIKDSNGREIVNPNGTHSDFYNRLFDYDEHILLSSFHEDFESPKLARLLTHLRKEHPKRVIIQKYMDIGDIISVEEIRTKAFRLLNFYKNDEVEIFISPGTPAMQTAWYLLAPEFENVSLFQVRPPWDQETKRGKEFIKVLHRGLVNGHAIKEESKRCKKSDNAPFVSKSNQSLFDKAERVAIDNRSTVLILGETGTGKGVLAKFIHNESLRNTNSFVPINCGAIGDELLESRLFGYMKGAHNQAYKNTPGAFEEAHKGTLFLDEIGDISKKMQQTLLKILDDGEVYRIGSSKPIKVDVRIIAATNKNLLELVRQGSFRADLYYRLLVVEMETIPYRSFSSKEQSELSQYFIEKLELVYKRDFPKISKEVKKYLADYWFPGNLRELQHLLESFCASCEKTVEIQDIPDRIKDPTKSITSLILEDITNRHIEKVWRMFSGNTSKAAKALEIQFNTLQTRIKKFGWKI